MASRDLVVVGASAGGVAALQRLVAALPASLPAAVLVVLHLAPRQPSLLSTLLNRAGALSAANAQDGEAIRPGRIYVAPPDRHLLVAPGLRVALSSGPRENRARPAIDPLFRSAAALGGPRVIGVILTGYLHDGPSGLAAVQAAGGLAVVQAPEDAEVPDLPRHALAAAPAAHALPLAAIPPLLVARCGEAVSTPPAPVGAPEAIPEEATVEPTLLTCPDCGGVLSEQPTPGGALRYVCHVGHAYSPHALEDAEAERVDGALWHAIRLLEEHAMACRRLARRAVSETMTGFRAELEHKAAEAEQDAATVRQLLERGADRASRNAETARSE